MATQEQRDGHPLALLGVPTLALALAATVVTTYLPVVAQGFVRSTLIVGLIIGVEGLFALWLPLVIGAWSDRLRTPIGGRLPFILAGTPLLAIGLCGMAVAGSIAPVVVAAVVFFAGYFLAYEPYRALYPDLVSEDQAGRAQANQALWRGAGTGLALLGGGLLLSAAQAGPFVAAAAVCIVATALLTRGLIRKGVPDEAGAARGAAIRATELVRGSRRLRAFLIANALWELSLGALKTFIVLYVTTGLGFSRSAASGIIGGVAVLVLLAALASGELADRIGPTRVLALGLPVYGLAMLVPFVTDAHLLVALAVPFVAIGGGAIMALPYAVLIPLMPDEEHGTLTGVYSFSRGIGTWLGPLLAGLAIATLGGLFDATHGYQAMWLVCSASVLLSLPFVRRL